MKPHHDDYFGSFLVARVNPEVVDSTRQEIVKVADLELRRLGMDPIDFLRSVYSDENLYYVYYAPTITHTLGGELLVAIDRGTMRVRGSHLGQ